MAVITLQNLSKWYGEVIGLNCVNASIGNGITGLLGPNGAGKTTLMGLATGQLRPSQGRIRVFDKRPWDNPSVLARIGFCPEGDPFWRGLTGWQFVHLLVRISGIRGRAARDAARQAIERTGMTPHMNRPIKGYSKGMRQRIKMAQAIAHRPELLILDEPFTGADPVSRHELADLFRSLADEGVDVLLSSHVLHEVEALTRQIVMIDHGRIVAEGDVGEVRRQLHHRPHAIRVRTADPRALAAGVATLASVRGIEIEDELLLVRTTTPEEVYDAVGRILRHQKLDVLEISPADDSLEAVFGYLTQRGGAERT